MLNRLKQTDIPEKYSEILNRFNEYSNLDNTQKKILHFKILRFLHEKRFIGINIDITDEIKVTTAFFACYITVAYEYFCYPVLKYIYIYPYTVVLNDKRENYGVVDEGEVLISGEAVGESVVLVWNEIKREIHHNYGRNVVIHEFAHELDFEEGAVDGIPPIEKSKYSEWNKIMFGEFNRFKNRILKNRFLGKYSFIDRYAATNKAEFFAVMSEYYFEKPSLLKKYFPDVYKELKSFYRIENVRINK